MSVPNEKLETLNFNLSKLEEGLLILQDKLSIKVCDLESLEIDPQDFIEQYEQLLDDLEGEFMGMYASYILKECDPVAYSNGLNDYCDSIDISETETYIDIKEEIETLESEIEDQESSIEELEEDIEELENEED